LRGIKRFGGLLYGGDARTAAPATEVAMSRAFPKNEPMLQGLFAPVFVEGDSSDLPVTGDIPAAVRPAQPLPLEKA